MAVDVETPPSATFTVKLENPQLKAVYLLAKRSVSVACRRPSSLVFFLDVLRMYAEACSMESTPLLPSLNQPVVAGKSLVLLSPNHTRVSWNR